jgi:hypothetical protein
MLILLTLVFTLALTGAAGALFGWGAWWLLRRYGRAATACACVISAVLVSGLFALRVSARESWAGSQHHLPVFGYLVPMWCIALGAVAFVVDRRVRGGAVSFDARLVRRSVVTCWIALGACAAVVSVIDLVLMFGPGAR